MKGEMRKWMRRRRMLEANELAGRRRRRSRAPMTGAMNER